jgi:hypothetical protein
MLQFIITPAGFIMYLKIQNSTEKSPNPGVSQKMKKMKYNPRNRKSRAAFFQNDIPLDYTGDDIHACILKFRCFHVSSQA